MAVGGVIAVGVEFGGGALLVSFVVGTHGQINWGGLISRLITGNEYYSRREERGRGEETCLLFTLFFTFFSF